MLATLLELLQVAPQNRSADWRDILWSTLGALTTTHAQSPQASRTPAHLSALSFPSLSFALG